MKKAEKTQAIELRKRGFTYSEIAQYTNVSVSTVSAWLSAVKWSQKITEDNQKRASKENSKRISLLNTARGNQNKKRYAEAERSAVTEYKHYRSNPLFIAGLTLYTGLGDVTASHQMRITSTRTDIHRIFISFATEYLGVQRETVRFWLSLYPDLKPEKCSYAWSKALRIPLLQFHKYQIIDSRSKKSTLHSGVGNTIIGNAVLKKKLMKWIELLSKEL